MSGLRIDKSEDKCAVNFECEVRPPVYGGIWDEIPNIKALYGFFQNIIDGTTRTPEGKSRPDNTVKKPNS